MERRMEPKHQDDKIIADTTLSTVGILRSYTYIAYESPGKSFEDLCVIDEDEFSPMYAWAAETFYRATLPFDSTLHTKLDTLAPSKETPLWKDISRDLSQAYIARLKAEGVNDRIITLSRENIDLEGARKDFTNLVENSSALETEKTLIFNALKRVTLYHSDQSFGKDGKGLFHIPYVQHSLNIAIHTLKLGFSAEDVIVALFHDVIEDTYVTPQKLQEQFGQEVLDKVLLLTKQKGQSRAEFLHHVSELKGAPAAIKCLDRFDNLIRSFSLNDRDYFRRILKECDDVYDGLMDKHPELDTFRTDYDLLKAEIRLLISRE